MSYNEIILLYPHVTSGEVHKKWAVGNSIMSE